MRLFIAINFNDETRIKLLALRNKLQSFSKCGHFSLTENLHLTLAFLGRCDEKQTIAAKRVMNSVRFEPFSITIAGGGYLDKGRPNLVFCSLQNDSGYGELWQLQSELYQNLSVKGFELDKRKFWPHITLGREVVWKDIGDYSSFIDVGFPTIQTDVTNIVLMKSEQINGKLTYTVIHERK